MNGSTPRGEREVQVKEGDLERVNAGMHREVGVRVMGKATCWGGCGLPLGRRCPA